MRPRKIVLIRHGEEPTDPRDPDLSIAGHKRAQRLAVYLRSKFGSPDFLFASAPHKLSARPFLTLLPLAHWAKMRIDTSVKAGNPQSLATRLFWDESYADSVVMICWTHTEIPALAAALGAKEGECPDPWDETTYDLSLKFRFARSKATIARIKQPF